MGVSQTLPSAWEDTLTDYRIKHFWMFGLIAVFLHGVADPFVTYLTVNVQGVGTEANPWLATQLQSGMVDFILVHIPLYVMIFGIFVGFTWLFHRGSDSEREQIYKLSLVLWLLIILWGIVIVSNNMYFLMDSIGLF